MSHVFEKLILAKDLQECVVCRRHFVSERIKTHEDICQKSWGVSRKVFDISQQRIKGTEAEKFAQISPSDCLTKIPKNSPCGLSTNWRGKHEDLVKRVKEAKKVAHEKKKRVNDLPYPPPMKYDKDYVQCENCLRQLNEKSAARHIPICAARMCRRITNTNTSRNSISSSHASFSNK